MPIKAILFDMFDTLMLIQKEHAFYSPAMKRMHAYITKNGLSISFPVFRDAYIKARDALYQKADQTMEEPHFNYRVSNALQNLGYDIDHNHQIIAGATNQFYQEFMNYVIIDEHTKETLEKLHGKYKLGLVSNFAIPECVEELLEIHNLKHLFDVIIVSGAVNRRKPNHEIYKYALTKLNVEPSETIFVGDTLDADVQGPKELGMKSVYIDRRPQKILENMCPDQTIKKLIDLPQAIECLD